MTTNNNTSNTQMYDYNPEIKIIESDIDTLKK